MSETVALDALQKVVDIAGLAGISGELDAENEVFAAGFELPGGRSQVVYVKFSGEVNDLPFVTVYSPCLEVKKGFLKNGLTRDQAIELLKANNETNFARYAVSESEKVDLILASVDHLLDTLDAEELEANMWCVAMAADAYEKIHGQDVF